ncbi:putative ribonuclease H-like domain-containing protein [Tanacetum coccineum]
MRRNMSYLSDSEETNGGYVAFGGNPKGGKITDRVPRKNNMYSVDLKNIVPKGGLTFLFAKATSDESKLWHRRLGHINFKTMNKLVKGNLVRGLPSKLFENDQTCVACQKGKQHRASSRTPQQNGVAERKNRTLIEAARTMLADSKLPTTFWAEAVNRLLLGNRPNWLFDIDALIKSMNYKPVVAANGNAGTKACDDAGDNEKYVTKEPGKEGGDSHKDSESSDQEKEDNVNSTNNVNDASTNEVNVVGAKTRIELLDDLNMPELEDIVYSDNDEDVGAEADMNNLDAFMPVSPIPTTRIHKDRPVEQIIGDLNSAPQTRRMTKNLEEHGLKRISMKRTKNEAKNDKTEHGMEKREKTKNKKDERGIVIKNKAILVVQGYTHEEGIDYDEVFAFVARIEEIRLFLSYASFKDFVVYQMDVKSAFLYGKIEKEVYVCQPLGFEDPDFPDRVYKVEKALYGLHQAPRAWYETLSTYLLDNGFQRGKIDKTLFIRRDKGDILLVQVYVDDIIFGSTKKSLCTEFEKMMHKKFQMSSIGELTFFLGLQVKQKKDGIFISQDKYVTEILKKFGFTDVKTASTPMETQKLLLKDEDGEEVDVHLYRSMIGSLMYLTSSRPDIMFVVCACARYQVNPKVLHLHAVKRIFRYLKGQPKLGLWYPKDSPFDLVAYTNSDYTGASLDRKSTTRCCQFLRSRLISWRLQIPQQKLINAGDSKLMLLGINLLLLGKVNAARHKLTAAGES